MVTRVKQGFVDQQVLYGTRTQRFLREFVTHSGIFWLFDSVTNIGSNGLVSYLGYLPQWALLFASLVQAWVISRNERNFRWWYVFIAPLLYTIADIGIEGWYAFFEETYHLFYWGWAAVMSLAYLSSNRFPSIAVFLRAVLLVTLLPALYFFAELETEVVVSSSSDFMDYWFADSGHFFILSGSLILGMTLGIVNLMRERFERLLYSLASHFEEVASWSFDDRLIQQAYTDESTLDLQRVQRTVLFMDIRGFTPWSESHSPHEVVQIVNHFYQTAEPVIKANHGFKIQMTGDEIMTRFAQTEDALQAALELQPKIASVLAPFGLSAGIGIHTGEVIEGLVGGEQTRQYGIFGDTVNTAARLQGQAKANEIVISNSAWHATTHRMSNLNVQHSSLTLKGKAEAMPVVILKPAVAVS